MKILFTKLSLVLALFTGFGLATTTPLLTHQPPAVTATYAFGIDDVFNAVTNLPGTIAGKIIEIISSPFQIGNLISTVLSWFNGVIGGTSCTENCLKDPGFTQSGTTSLATNEILRTDDPRYVERYGLVGLSTALLDQTFKQNQIKTVDYLAAINPIGTEQVLAETGYDQISGNRNSLGQLANSFFKQFRPNQLPEKPILAAWVLFRNISYAIFVVILVAIGFMIMFRSKLDPRTVVTVTNSLPRVVISLVLITFSFPIAGLMVDIMNVALELIKNTFGPLIRFPPDLGIMGIFNFAILTPYTLPGDVGSILTSPLTFPAMVLLQIVFRLAVLIIIFMLIFILILRWVNVIFLAIFSPLFFLWGALPGREGAIGAWFRGMLANLLSFPAVLAVLYLAILLKFASGLTPPAPVAGIISAADIGGLMTFAALVLATKVPSMLEEALKAGLGRASQAGFTEKNLPLIGGMFK